MRRIPEVAVSERVSVTSVIGERATHLAILVSQRFPGGTSVVKIDLPQRDSAAQRVIVETSESLDQRALLEYVNTVRLCLELLSNGRLSYGYGTS